MSRYHPGSAGAGLIAAAFAESFSAWSIALPEGAVGRGEPGVIHQAGWTIRFIFSADEEGSYLEYYATHRMTNDTRVRIYGSGRTEALDAIWEMFVWDPKVPGDEDRARREYHDHNSRIAQELKRLGLYPEGDINAYLRTEGPPSEEPSQG